MESIQELLSKTDSNDDKTRSEALNIVLEITDLKVDWIYDYLDQILDKLNSPNAFQRSLGMMLLCNLAKSDYEDRFNHILQNILDLLEDEKFIPRRQTIQNLWKIALVKPGLSETILKTLESKYENCLEEKHYNLIRQDIISCFFTLYKQTNQENLLTRIEKLIGMEESEGNRKKYKKLMTLN